MLKFILLDKYFSKLFTDDKICHCKTFKFGPGCLLETKVVYNQNMAVFHIGAVSKDIKSKINFYRHNILRPFDNLAFFATSET